MIFLDDDDLIHPRMVEEALDVLSQRPEADVVTFLWECIFTPSSLDATFPIALLFDYKRLAQHPLVHAHQRVALPKCIEQDPISALLRYTVAINSCFFRRAAIGTMRFPESLRYGEDSYFLVALAHAGRRFVLNEYVCAYVRRHAGNITNSSDRLTQVPECYTLMLKDGLITAPDDIYRTSLLILQSRLRARLPLRFCDVCNVIASPRLLWGQIREMIVKHRARRRLMDYYTD